MAPYSYDVNGVTVLDLNYPDYLKVLFDRASHINIPSNGKWVELKMNDFFGCRKR